MKINQVNVGKYTSPMDPMGMVMIISSFFSSFFSFGGIVFCKIKLKAWVLDFAGFGLVDCNPKVAAPWRFWGDDFVGWIWGEHILFTTLSVLGQYVFDFKGERVV